MPLRLAIFDFDGTLADSLPWFLGAVNRAADRYGFLRIEGEAAQALRGEEARSVVRHVGLPAWKLPLVAAFMRREMGLQISEIALFPGVTALLEELSRRGVALAVVSSNSEANVRAVLGPRHAGLIGHYGCGAALFGKRAKLRRVLRGAGVAPREALCIGDEIRDLRAARAEGIPFGAVTWGYTTAEALAARGPERVFSRVEEILQEAG